MSNLQPIDLGTNERERTKSINDNFNTLKSDVQRAKDYANLDNKPQINGITLEGNKDLEDIGIENIQPISNYDLTQLFINYF